MGWLIRKLAANCFKEKDAEDPVTRVLGKTHGTGSGGLVLYLFRSL